VSRDAHALSRLAMRHQIEAGLPDRAERGAEDDAASSSKCGGVGFTQSIANLSTANLPEGGNVALACSDNGLGDVFIQDAHLVATSVGSVARSQS
jgi:hypothetical protein